MPAIIGPKEAVDLARARGAVVSGHFWLASGRHSQVFFDRQPLERDPEVYQRIGRLLVEQLPQALKEPDAFDSLAPVPTGGIALARVVSRYLPGHRQTHKIAGLKTAEGKVFEVRSRVEPGEEVVIVEDVVTTGGSVEQVGNKLTDMGALVVAVFELANRKANSSEIAPNEHFLIRLADAASYDPDQCPACERGIELVKL